MQIPLLMLWCLNIAKEPEVIRGILVLTRSTVSGFLRDEKVWNYDKNKKVPFLYWKTGTNALWSFLLSVSWFRYLTSSASWGWIKTAFLIFTNFINIPTDTLKPNNYCQPHPNINLKMKIVGPRKVSCQFIHVPTVFVTLQ